jgi:heptosyltransferase-2
MTTIEVMKKILIIQTAFLGDVLLTLPIVAVLREIYAGAVIDMMVLPGAKNLVETNPDVAKCIIFDKRNAHKGFKGLKLLARYIAEEGYDLCITPHRSWRSAYLSFKTNAPRRIGFNRSSWQGAFSDVVPYINNDHEIQRNLSLLEPLGIHPPISRPQIYPTGADAAHVKALLRPTDRKIIALAPGSIWPTKRWPEAYFRKLCERLVDNGYTVVLIGGEEDGALCERLAADQEEIQSFAGRLSLRQTYFLLTQSIALITNDSAPLHMGTAAGLLIFAFFGATVPTFGFTPIGTQDKVLELVDLACRPCGIHGHNKCPMNTFNCMEALTPALVWPVIQQTLENNRVQN